MIYDLSVFVMIHVAKWSNYSGLDLGKIGFLPAL